MNIPLEPTKPLEGVSSPAPGVEAPQAPKTRPYRPRALQPARMWALINVVTHLTKRPALDIARGIVPQVHGIKVNARGRPFDLTRKLIGFPGAGVFHGKTNIAKTLTYRATYVPGGFNAERNARRQQEIANASGQG